MLYRLSQKVPQIGVTQHFAVVLHHIFYPSSVSDDNEQLFCPGDGCIEEVPKIELVESSKDGENYSVVFTTLAFVDGDGVGKLQFRRHLEGIVADAVLEVDHDSRGGVVNELDDADIAVEDA